MKLRGVLENIKIFGTRVRGVTDLQPVGTQWQVECLRGIISQSEVGKTWNLLADPDTWHSSPLPLTLSPTLLY